MPLIVSLTAIPSRFETLEPVLSAILAQDVAIDEVRLHIPKRYRRFPDYDGTPPVVPAGVRIVTPDDDLGPASKVLFAAEDLRGTDTDIVYCDDDRIYPPDWFARMLAARDGRTDHCVATHVLLPEDLEFVRQPPLDPAPVLSGKSLSFYSELLNRKLVQLSTGQTRPKPRIKERFAQPGYAEIAEGFGAVLVRPDFFDASALDIPPILWSVDDIWLSGQMRRRGVPIWCAAGFEEPRPSNGADFDALYDAQLDGSGRHDANRACVKYMQETYGIWR